MAAKWGVPPELLSPAAISTFVETNVVTFDKLDPATGAFNPIPAAGASVPLPTIVAIPASPPPTGGWPLVVFHHGLTRSRGDVLFIAQALAGNGMVVAAIDAAKHGARAWCSKNTVNGVSTGCATGSTCDTTVFAQQQGDPATARPGLCTANGLQIVPIGCDPTATPGCWDGTGGNSVTSGSFLISANFFRSRDTVRQDILDQSMLVRVLTSASGQAELQKAVGSTTTIAINPARVFYVGQSLGKHRGHRRPGAEPALLPRGAERGRRHHHRHPHHLARGSAGRSSTCSPPSGSSRARRSTSSSSSPRSGSSTRPTRPTSHGTS